MDATDIKQNNCKCTNYKIILTILGLSTCLFLAGTIYFLVKSYNQNKLISNQLLEYSNQLNFTKNQPVAFDDNFEIRMRKLFDDLDLTAKRSLFRDFFNHHARMNNLLNNSYSINRSTIQGVVSANLKCTRHLHEKCTNKKGHKIEGVNVNIDVILTQNEVVLYDRYSNVYNNTYLAQTRD